MMSHAMVPPNSPEFSMNQVAIPGILGGLGPLAHVEFERQLIEINAQHWYAHRDAQHPIWILINGTNVPDRTRSLSGLAEDCTPWLLHYGQILQRAGAQFLVITCNTAHGFYHKVQPHLEIPWLHLMEITSHHIRQHYPHCQKIGILATDGTVKHQLYDISLRRYGLTPLSLQDQPELQRLVMASIYHPQWGVKATGDWVTTEALAALDQALQWLHHQDCQLVIAGCTEISVAFARHAPQMVPWVDPLTVAAHFTLDLAYGRRQISHLPSPFSAPVPVLL